MVVYASGLKSSRGLAEGLRPWPPVPVGGPALVVAKGAVASSHPLLGALWSHTRDKHNGLPQGRPLALIPAGISKGLMISRVCHGVG